MTEFERALVKKRVHTHWEEYSKVIGEGAGPTQIKETKQAFYCGMFVMNQVMQCLAGVDVDDPSDETLTMKMLTDHDTDLTNYMVHLLLEQGKSDA